MPNTSQELVLRISGDSKSAQAAIGALADALKGLGEHLDGTRSSASSLGGQMKEAFEHPLDAVKTLSGSIGGQLLDSLGSTGVVAGVAAGALAGLTLVAAELAKTAFELAEKAAEVGEHIRDVSLKTGESVPAVSRLTYAMQVAGGSIDQVSNAMFMFERRMSDSPDVVDKGLRKIGLALEDIQGIAPEVQFQLIAQAVSATEDPVDRAGALFGIFGRQGRELAPIMEKLNDAMALTASITPFTEQEAKDAEAFAMQVRALRVEFDQLSISAGRELITPAQFFLDWLRDIKTQLSVDFYLAFGGFVEQWRLLASYIAIVKGDKVDLPPLAGQVAGSADAAKLQAAKDAAFDAARTPEALRASLFSGGSLGPLTTGLEFEKSITADLTGKLELLNAARREAAAALKAANAELERHIKLMVENSALAVDSANAIAKSFGGQTVLRDLLMAQGLAGGAPVLAASKVFSAVGLLGGPEVRNQFGETISGVIAAMPDLSASAQKRIADLLAGGPTMKEQFADGLSGVLQQAPQILVSSLTGGGGLKGAAEGVGSLLGGTLGKTIGKSISMLGKFGGPIGEAIGSLAGPLLGMLFNIGGPSQQELQGRDVEAQFQKQFGSFDNMLGAIAKAYEATGRSAQQARDDVNALMAAEKLGGDAAKTAIDKITQAFNEQKQDAADLDAAIKKYGFSIEELGPALQKQHLSDMAHGLENDFRLLVASGIDMKIVIEHMGKALNDYLLLAIKTGQEVPLEMKPIVEEMIREGKLYDENGNKVTELGASGLKFSESFSQGIDRIVNKLNELLAGLGLIPKKIADIPREIDISARVHYDDPGDERRGAAAGGIVTPSGIARFAMGGIARYRGGWGTDTVPAMLTPGEIILNAAQQASVASRMGGVTIQVDASGSIFKDRQAMRELASVIGDHLAEHYAQVGGSIPLARRR